MGSFVQPHHGPPKPQTANPWRSADYGREDYLQGSPKPQTANPWRSADCGREDDLPELKGLDVDEAAKVRFRGLPKLRRLKITHKVGKMRNVRNLSAMVMSETGKLCPASPQTRHGMGSFVQPHHGDGMRVSACPIDLALAKDMAVGKYAEPSRLAFSDLRTEPRPHEPGVLRSWGPTGPGPHHVIVLRSWCPTGPDRIRDERREKTGERKEERE